MQSFMLALIFSKIFTINFSIKMNFNESKFRLIKHADKHVRNFFDFPSMIVLFWFLSLKICHKCNIWYLSLKRKNIKDKHKHLFLRKFINKFKKKVLEANFCSLEIEKYGLIKRFLLKLTDLDGPIMNEIINKTLSKKYNHFNFTNILYLIASFLLINIWS